MHLRLFRSRISTQVMRSSMLLKIFLTAIMVIFGFLAWYMFIYQGQVFQTKLYSIEVSDLNKKQSIFKSVLLEYKDLKSSLSFSKSKNHASNVDSLNCYKKVIIAARRSGLELLSYTKKKSGGSYKQMIFNFLGSYKELKLFINYLNHLGVSSCKRLRISSNHSRLQITYVCGIHTLMKT